MKIHLIKKEKGRVYRSEDMVRALFGLELAHDEGGAPFLRSEEGAAERFVSITDTKNYWACAVEGSRIGLDMEEAGRAVKPAVAKRFHKDEQAYLAVLSEGGREWTEEFLSIWTRKEAWAKYCGKGLKLPFSEFSVLDGALPAPEQENSAKGQADQLVPVVSFAYKNLVFGIAGAPGAAFPSRASMKSEHVRKRFSGSLLMPRLIAACTYPGRPSTGSGVAFKTASRNTDTSVFSNGRCPASIS